MLRIVLGVVAGFFSWLIVWVGSEKIISAIWPAFGTHQAAFQTAITDGGQFTADNTMLLTHIVMGSVISVMSGALAALIAGESSRGTFDRRHPPFSHGCYESSHVLAICSHLVPRNLYSGPASVGDCWRKTYNPYVG